MSVRTLCMTCNVCDQSSLMRKWHKYSTSEAVLQLKGSTATSIQFDLSTEAPKEAFENLYELSQCALKQTKWYAGTC